VTGELVGDNEVGSNGDGRQKKEMCKVRGKE